MRIAIISFFLLTNLLTYAQPTSWKAKDKEAIKSMAGCYAVEFNFAETFQLTDDTSYQASPNKRSSAVEWVTVVEDSEDKVVLQHLLVVGRPDSPMVIKHWRQDWVYEDNELYVFEKDNQWKYTQLAPEDVRGQWTQKVYQVDDSPRYEGVGTWIHLDDKSFWESTTYAPLPRREYTKRNDYNVMKRRNRHEITDKGWIHDQYNDKIVRKDGEDDIVLAQEKGINYYNLVEDKKCAAAQQWWNDNHVVWSKVRDEWNALFDQNQDLSLKVKVDDKFLFDHLLSLDQESSHDAIKKLIQQYTN